MLLVLLAALAVAPEPSETRTFSDWTVGCDNGLACQAIALLPENQQWEDWLTMRLGRGAGADDRPVLVIQNLETEPAALLVDGRPIAVRFSHDEDGFTVHAVDEDALVAALRTGEALEVRGRDGGTLGKISLAGASASMLFIDEAQRRLDTVTALIRRGPRPAGAVPPPPALPQVRLTPPPTDMPVALTDARVAALRRETGCTIDEVGGPDTYEVVQIETGKTLILLACGTGAYNLSSVPLIARSEGGRIEIAPFDIQWGIEAEGRPTLINAAWDAERRLLQEYSKGRGLGDCGTRADYAWDGTAFRLVHQEEMGECRGSLYYIPTWNARLISPQDAK